MELGIRLNLDASAAKGILERSGASKIRHMDVNNLWLQEQCARKIIPAIKVDGASNSSDLMTKHLTYGTIERHVKALQLEFRAGRSEAAAQLHHLRRKQRQEEFDKSTSILNIRDKKADRWGQRGESGVWMRLHATPRQSMFTPFKIPRGPGRSTKLSRTRITEGVDERGVQFKIVDDWTKPSESHRLMPSVWTGRTSFRVE